MNKNLSNEQLVGRYLDNEMSEIERLEFENQLLHDSDLKEEYNLQKEIIEGIKETRKLELKTRLDNLPINTPLYQTIGFKSLIVASISAGIGFGAYYLLSDPDELSMSEVDVTQHQELTTQNEHIPTIPDAIEPIIDEEKKAAASAKKEIQQPSAKNENPIVSKNNEQTKEPEIIQPNVIEPDVVEEFQEEDFTSEEINVENQINDLEKVKENVESTVEIETVRDRKNRFHYRFFENKLFLLGNFSEMPYEIIELNTQAGKSYFLFYNGNFYRLETEQLKPSPLIKIENDSLVSELKIIQMNQNN
jgi:hypothetical protein